jgi:hypothetical protein
VELKDTWKDLENYIEGVPDSGEMASADDINNIAHAVIDIENNKTTSISENPSNTKYPTEKAVADYVKNNGSSGGGIDVVDNLTSTDKDKALSANMGRELKEQIDNKMGDIETALDSIIAIQNKLIGGGSV